MTKEQLDDLRKLAMEAKAREGGNYNIDSRAFMSALASGVLALLADVNLLQAMLHDLQEESTAYQRGLKDGTELGYTKGYEEGYDAGYAVDWDGDDYGMDREEDEDDGSADHEEEEAIP